MLIYFQQIIFQQNNKMELYFHCTLSRCQNNVYWVRSWRIQYIQLWNCVWYEIIVSAYWYIAITTLAIIAVFLEYLRHFLIDFNQIYRHSSVPKTTSIRAFLELFSSSGFRARRRRDFFVTLCVPRCSESVDCPTLAYFGLINVFPVTVDARRRKIEIFLSWA